MKNRSNDELSLQVLKKFRVIYGSMRQHFREIERACGVSGSQLWLLQEIVKTPGIGVSELAERLSIHQSTCSLLVEKLTLRELIIKKRSSTDQRRVGLHPSEQSSALIKCVPGPAEGLLPGALRTLPNDTINALNMALEEVIQQMRISDNKLAEKPLSDM